MWERWRTRKEMEQIHASHQREKNPICYLQSWLGETFGVWMGTIDPGGHIFRHMCPAKISAMYEGKIPMKIHAKKQQQKKKHAAIATFMQSASGVCASEVIINIFKNSQFSCTITTSFSVYTTTFYRFFMSSNLFCV